MRGAIRELSKIMKLTTSVAASSQGRTSTNTMVVVVSDGELSDKYDAQREIERLVSDVEKGSVNRVSSVITIKYGERGHTQTLAKLGDVAEIGNFALLCRNLLKPGGTVILTLMDGERVVQQLNEAKAAKSGESWDEREPPVDGVLKYSVRRWFSDAGLSEAGQKIAVLLPFSDSRYYEEYLSNIDTITKVFLAKKFTLASREPLWDTFESKFRTEQPHKFKALTEADKKWLRLFVAVRFIAP